MERNEAIEVIKKNYPHVTESGSQFEYDSCEYITIYSGVSHKGNCKYCKEHRKQELKELKGE